MKGLVSAVLGLAAIAAVAYGAAASSEFDDEFGAEAVQQEVTVEVAAESIPMVGDEEEAAFEASPADPEAPEEADIELSVRNVVAPRSYWVEGVGVVTILATVALYFYGTQANQHLAQRWMTAMRPVFAEQFAEIGINHDEGSLMWCEAHDCYRFFASGRVNCKGALVTLDLVPRHNLMQLVYGLLSPRSDTVTIEVPMHADSMPMMVLAALPQRKMRSLVTPTNDVGSFAGEAPIPAGQLPEGGVDGVAVFTDTKAALEAVLTPAILDLLSGSSREGGKKAPARALNSKRALLEMIHITDQLAMVSGAATSQLADKAVRFRFKLPGAARLDELAAATREAFAMVDRLAGLKLSKKAELRNKGLRERRFAEARRELEAEQKREQEEAQREARRQREQELAERDPELLERERAKRMAKKARRRTKMVSGRR